MIVLPDGMCEYNAFDSNHVVGVSGFDSSEPALTVLLLNLMPEKQVTEQCIIDMLQGYGKHVRLIPMKISGQTYKTTSNEYMQRYYTDFENLSDGFYDGLIVTGAPLEQISYEDVRYWKQLCGIMDWATEHVCSTLYICWAAQAALYHHYGITKHALSDKRFGIYDFDIQLRSCLLPNAGVSMKMPLSCHTAVRLPDVEACKDLRILTANEQFGVGIVFSEEKSCVYVIGHLEYPAKRLDFEYRRDLSKGLRILPPENYYASTEDMNSEVLFSWNHDALCFYHAWLDSCLRTSHPKYLAVT